MYNFWELYVFKFGFSNVWVILVKQDHQRWGYSTVERYKKNEQR